MPNTPEEIGQLIKKLRLKQNLTQSELGGRLGLQRSTIALYEKGHNNFTVLTLQKIADALGVSLIIDMN